MKKTPVNESSPIKPRRPRRTRDQMQRIRDAMEQLLREDHPMTVRQVFYQMVCRALIAKTEGQYKNTVGRLLSEMRREGLIPFDWLADNTRWMRKPDSYGSLAGFLQSSQNFYRRDLWNEQDAYVEVWLEKEALSGVLYDVTARWDVPLMATRGYPSLSFLHSAAEVIDSAGKPCFLYYFGDLDPSGQDIPRKIEADLRTFAPDADLTFQRVGVTREQVAEWNLPTRPTKTTDSRSKNFAGESVELDAIPSARLRELCQDRILQHIDPSRLNQLRRVEAQERETLSAITRKLSPSANWETDSDF